MPGAGHRWIEGGEVLGTGEGQGWMHSGGRRRTGGGEEKGREGPSSGQGQLSVSFALSPLNRAIGKFHTDQCLLLWGSYGHPLL